MTHQKNLSAIPTVGLQVQPCTIPLPIEDLKVALARIAQTSEARQIAIEIEQSPGLPGFEADFWWEIIEDVKILLSARCAAQYLETSAAYYAAAVGAETWVEDNLSNTGYEQRAALAIYLFGPALASLRIRDALKYSPHVTH